MKRLLLLLIFTTYYSNAQHVQIDFVEDFFITVINPVPLSPSEGSGTTDSQINTIFTTHNISNCYSNFGSPVVKIFAVYSGRNIDGFIADLESNVNISKATQTPFPYTYVDILYMQLANGAIGNPTGTDLNGNIITSNEDLNLIFSNYQVKSMSNLVSDYYQISFEGNINLLKNELEALENVVAVTNYRSNYASI